MKRQILTILAAALVAVPAASATWFAFGTYEPDTIHDQLGDFMPEEASHTAGSQALYFNAYQASIALGTSANAGLLGSRQQMVGNQHWRAMLGPWLDCNNDDYVGLAESALITYPASVLNTLASNVGDTLCPVGSPQNDGQWVYEYRPVGSQVDETAPFTMHAMQINDSDARVWGDVGLPGSLPPKSCIITPLSHGTTSGTGWFLRYADCFAGYQVQRQITNNDPTPGKVLAWDCPPSTTNCSGNPQKSDSLLNQQAPQSLFGNPETGETGTLQLDSEEDGGAEEPAYTMWNCNGRAAEVKDPTGLAPETIEVADPTFDPEEEEGLFGNTGRLVWTNLTDDDGNYAWVAAPAPDANDPTHSFADGFNETFRGFRVGGGDDAVDPTVGGDCDTERDEDTESTGDFEDGENTYSSVHQTAFFVVDFPNEPVGDTRKASDMYFTYSNGGEKEGITAVLFGANSPPNTVSSPPTHGGFFTEPGWRSFPNWATLPQVINRATFEPDGPRYWTFYAKVGTYTTSRGYVIPGSSDKYGSEACGSAITGVVKGWECNAAKWNTDSNGLKLSDGTEAWRSEVGWTYQFRDVDCNDGSPARGSGVWLAPVQLSPGVDEDRDPSTPNTKACVDAKENL